MADAPRYSVVKGQSEASIDQVNQWMRQTDWYQGYMRSIGQDPGHPTLTKSQSTQVKKLAQANGVVVDEGNIELDDHGNFNPIGHKLRNTLIIAGAAAAAIAAPYAYAALAGGGATAAPAAASLAGIEGGAAGLSSSALAALGTGAMSTVPVTAGALSTIAPVVGKTIAPLVANGAKSTIGGDILRYGVPIAGDIAGKIIQSKASSAASAEERKYLEEALAYQKEQDAYARARQEKLDEQDKARYGDTRSDIALQQQRDAARTAEEGGRYGDFQNNLAPFIANGVNANSAMASRLGLPATATWTPNAPRAASSGQRYTDPKQDASKLSDADKLKIDALLQKYDSGDDADYWYGVAAQHGGFDKTGADWLDMRIKIGDNAGKGYKGSPTPAPTTTTPPPADTTKTVAPPPEPDLRTATPPYRPDDTPRVNGDQSTAAPSMVTIAAPTGETQQVPESELDHWLQRGARRVA